MVRWSKHMEKKKKKTPTTKTPKLLKFSERKPEKRSSRRRKRGSHPPGKEKEVTPWNSLSHLVRKRKAVKYQIKARKMKYQIKINLKIPNW